MNDIQEKSLNIILLFSLGVPLDLWQKTGLAAREKAYYQRFSEQGHQVALLTYGKKDLKYMEFWQPITILPWVGKLTHFVKYACLAPFYHIQAFRLADIVKSNQSQGSLVGAIAKLVNPKLHFILRCGWVRTKDIIREKEHRTGFRYYRAIFFEWLGYKLADAIIVVTESDADYLVNNYAASRRKIHIIPNAVDTKKYQFLDCRIREKIDNNLRIDLLLVGRLVEAKNFHKVFEAVNQLSEFDIHITVAGEGEFKKELEKLAQQLALQVDFLGSVANDELAELYRKSDITIMPEAWGSGMPKVVLEAMASGSIIIASNIRSVNQILRSEDNGFICEPSIESILESIQAILMTNEDKLHDISRNARHEIETKFSMEVCVKKEIELYKSLIK